MLSEESEKKILFYNYPDVGHFLFKQNYKNCKTGANATSFPWFLIFLPSWSERGRKMRNPGNKIVTNGTEILWETSEKIWKVLNC